MGDSVREQTEAEGMTVLCIQRALDDAWPDGKRRQQLQRVMQDRMRRLQERGFNGLEDCRRRDRETYDRFLAGCERAMRRDGLIAAGVLSQYELREMKERALVREHDAQFADVAEDFERRYGS